MRIRTAGKLHNLVAALVLAGIGAAGTAHADPVAQAQNGPVAGIAADGMREFLGIRYAAPPTGPLRWQPPQPVPADMATTAATGFGPHCAQLASPYGIASTSEDCLYLNVYAPQQQRAAGSRPLPVMVWIHGGALVVGESDDYNPVHLVTAGDVIVVTINYRLGYLGYLAGSGLDAEGHVAANYGLQDQQFALDWVRRNIAGFGGDSQRITIFGESAGGLSVLSNLVSPTGHGLFNRAIVESGAYALKLPTLPQAEAAGDALAGAMGCTASDTACLRALTVPQILAQEASPTLSITTIVDGTTLPLSINAALKSGQFNRVPIVNGSNRDEYRLFLSAQAGLTADQYPGVLATTYGTTLGAAVATEYPVTNYTQPVLALAAVITDQVFACTARQVDRWASPFVPVYAYEFNDENAPEPFLPPTSYNFGAAHASEIQFLFETRKLPGTPPLTADEVQLSQAMVKYWTNFARHASPDTRNVWTWPPYTNGTDVFQSLVPPVPTPESTFSTDHHCTFWEPVINPS